VDYEIIVVDDGSTDSTGSIADELAKEIDQIKVIHQSNGGYGVALAAGINLATKELVAYVPADGQFLVDDMRHCFELIGDNDLILGYRGGRSDYTVGRILLSYGYLTLLTIMYGLRYMDVGWVHIWRVEKLKRLDLKGTRGIFILTEIVIRFQRLGWKIVEGPSYYHPRLSGEAKNARASVVLSTLISALRLWAKLKWGKI
jgi:glycosyltransferase involved in cell wall biosynthesis